MVILFTIALTVGVLTAVALIWTKVVNDRGGCPDCGAPVPLWRHPTSLRQALWGGSTCERCGTELDRLGRKLIANS